MEPPSVTDILFAQGAIPSDLVSVSFEPTTTLSDENGELTFGGTDSSKFTGSITFAYVEGLLGRRYCGLLMLLVDPSLVRHLRLNSLASASPFAMVLPPAFSAPLLASSTPAQPLL